MDTNRKPAADSGSGGALDTEEAIFLATIALPAVERAGYLAAECGEDVARRRRIEVLVGMHMEGGFMEGPAEPPEEEAEEAEGALTGFEPGRVAAGDFSGEQPGDRIGHYRLVRRLGEGGFGTVWQAAQEAPLRRQVALKILKPGMDTQEVVRRFGKEREALALMDHPNIARIFDAGATPTGRPFITMELLEGVKITDYCTATHVPLRGRLELMVQVCRALRHAHQKGIVHRDLKPSNVLVVEEQRTPIVKVIDFGVAKATQSEPGEFSPHTQSGHVIGTPLYMSPEQTGLAGHEVDARADIYALGVLLYELLTGATPIPEAVLKEKGLDEVRRLIREEDPARPSQRLRSLAATGVTTTTGVRASLLSGDLDWIVLKCLEKDWRRRYESAEALGADLERYLRDQPVLARPPSALYSLKKTIRRHRTFFAAVAAVLVALLAGTVASTRLALRSMKAERVADALREEALLRAYEADMSAASLLLARGETGQVAQLVERYLPQSGLLPDLRGFEWYYLEGHTRGNQAAVFKGHDNMVSTVAFSRDGRLLASGDLGGRILVWDVASARVLATPLEGDSRVVGVSFSHDDRFLAAGDVTHLHVWSVPDFRLVRRLEITAARPLYSPTEPLMAVGVRDDRWYGVYGETRLWAWQEDENGERMRVLPNAGTRLAFSADGATLATGSGAGKARWWDVATARELGAVAQDSSFGLALAGDGSWLASCSTLRSLPPSVWSLPEGGRLSGPFEARTGVTALAASPVENVLAMGSADQRILLWDMTVRREKTRLTGHRNEVTALAFSPDGQWLASGGKDETVMLWRTTEPPPREEISGVRARFGMGGVVLSPDGTLAAICSDAARPLIFRTDTLEAVTMIDTKGWPLAFSPTGEQLVTLYESGVLEVWDTASGRSLGRRALPAQPFSECLSALSADGSLLGLCDRNHLYLIDTRTGAVLAHDHEHHRLILGSAFSPDGRLHATVSQDRRAILREARSGRILHVLTGHKQDIRGVAFSPDSRWLATGAHDNLVKIWDTASGQAVASLSGHKQVVNFLAFATDGKTLFSAGDEEEVLLWRTEDWRPLGRYPVPAPVRSLAVATHRHLLAVNGHPSVLKLFATPLPPAPDASHVPTQPWVLTELPPLSEEKPPPMPPGGPR